MKRSNPKRRKRERERAYGPPERREWVKTLDCVACGRVATEDNPSVNSHIKPDPDNLTEYRPSGMGRKEDYRWVVPLCPDCHSRLDTHPEGQKGFERECFVDLNLEACLVEIDWQKKSEKPGTIDMARFMEDDAA